MRSASLPRPSFRVKVFASIFLSLFLVCIGVSEFVELEDVKGRVIKAEILNVRDGSVRILHENGREYEIPFERLSAASLNALLELRRTKARQGPLLERSNRLAVTVAFNKKDRLDLAENFDDRLLYFSPRVKISNGDISNSFLAVKCTLAIIGESVVEKDARKVLSKQEFTVDLPRRGEATWTGQKFRVAYDEVDNGERFGYKLDGYIFVIQNTKDEIVYSYASGTSWLKPEDKVFSLDPDIVYERTLTKRYY